MSKKFEDNKNASNAQGKSQLFKEIHFETIDSTNTWAKNHWQEWDPLGLTIVSATTQTAGRGRFKRQWHSPPHVNLYVTYCFWLKNHTLTIGHVPQLLALAAVHVLEKMNFLPTIKWPNDVLLQGKKVAGILCETIVINEKRGIVCGIGLNVNMTKEDLSLIDRPATSLYAETGLTYDLKSIQTDIQHCFAAYLDSWSIKGFDIFFALLNKHSTYQEGDLVYFNDHQGIVKAYFEKLHPDGSVWLRLMDGSLKICHAGEFNFN